jgi:NCS1 family nucleobase:cation symporter-1
VVTQKRRRRRRRAHGRRVGGGERQPELWNDDLRPCTRAEHTWNGSAFATLWIGMCLCMPTYSLASGMIALGMNWWQAVSAIFLGSAIVLIPILLVAHAGTRYGIPYPVFARLWFGVRGAHLPALARALIAAGWFGINSWFGGLALDAIASAGSHRVARHRRPRRDRVRRSSGS